MGCQGEKERSVEDYRRLNWDDLAKHIDILIKQLNETNIRDTVKELSSMNLVMARGLFCNSLLKAQRASPHLAPIYAALVAAINPQFPEVTLLLLDRIVYALMKIYIYVNNDYIQDDVIAIVKLVAHLVNQRLVCIKFVAELLGNLFLDPVRDYNVAIALVTECSPSYPYCSTEELCCLVGDDDSYIPYDEERMRTLKILIPELVEISNRLRDSPAIRPELDLIGIDDQITHRVTMCYGVDPETDLDDCPSEI